VIQVPKAVEERALWRRFGKAKEGNEGTTARSVEDISIEKPGQEAKSELAMLAETQRSIFTCRKCGGPHSTLKCPYKDVTLGGGAGGPAAHTGPGAVQGGDGSSGAEGGEGGAGGKYVPPSQKRLLAAAAAGAPVPIEDLTTLRVTNLSEDAEEDDLRALFSRYGRLERVRIGYTRGPSPEPSPTPPFRVPQVHVAKDRETSLNRGFAFVTYGSHDEAERAKIGVNG
jgi:translation initiation factor 3 subunit G